MPFGGSKPPEYQAPNTYTNRLKQSYVENPFARTESVFQTALNSEGKPIKSTNNVALRTTTKPSEALQQGINLGGNVINRNLEYLQQAPDQRFASITGGNDLYYNVLADQLSKAQEQALGRARVAGQSRGLTNSTTQGAAIASIQNDALRRERENQLAAFNLGQTTATGNVGTGLGVLSGIGNIINPMQSQNLSTLANLRSQGDQIAMQQAQAKYQSDMARFQQQQANLAAWGQAIGGISPLGGFVFSGATGNPGGAVAGSQTFQNVLGALTGGMMGGGGSSLGSLSSAQSGTFI